ncbi:UNVERIFIED_CONTAM: hypothetical protein PYX00_010580 [Menopon gallinae]|uniref:Protein tumorous imaginal discs, mitochondrial-like n=2 Tax=Menopon gallinae TaxID=328185 RepID=A0AAW2HGA9_9NEOP
MQSHSVCGFVEMASTRCLGGFLSSKYSNSISLKRFSLVLSRSLIKSNRSKIQYYHYYSTTFASFPNFQPFPQNQVKKFHTSLRNVQRKRDYYEILNISRNASQKEIKKAYYELAKKYHPDRNKDDPNAAKKFQEVSEAYECLSDETKKKQYDQWGTTSEDLGRGMGGAGAGPRTHGFTAEEYTFRSSIDPEELFRKIFGDAGFSSHKFTEHEDFADSTFGFGSAQEVSMKISFTQAARGVNKDITLNVVDICPVCSGSKCKPGTKPTKCQFCNGTGIETISTGPFIMRSSCRYCQGSGVFTRHPCEECEGKGKTVQRKTVTVPVPAGVEDGQTVRMTVGKKEIFVTFLVEKSNYFRRDGSDIHTDATISLSQAVLGGTIRVQGLYEDQTIQIAPGTSSHSRIRLSGKGMKKVNVYGYGDHYVHIKIAIPAKLNTKQTALIQAYAELEEDTPGIIRGVTQKKDGSKICVSEPQNILRAIRNAISGLDVGNNDHRREFNSANKFQEKGNAKGNLDNNTEVKCDSGSQSNGMSYQNYLNRQKISKC